MFAFIKKLFGSKPAVEVKAPYKVEAPKAEAKPVKAKKPTVKKATTKPRKPKAEPKA